MQEIHKVVKLSYDEKRGEIDMLNFDKNCPTEETIAAIRRRFPVEAEIDRVLTRKMRRRPGVPFSPVTLDTLKSGAESLIGSNYEGPFEISDVQWMSGGASKLQVSFTLSWNPPDMGPSKTPMVLRMEPMESIVETSRLREFQIIRAFEGLVPVPPVYWVDTNAEHLPYPALIYGMVPGIVRPADAPSSGASGLATNVGPRFRELLAPQFFEHLKITHTHDFTNSNLTAFDIPKPGTQAAEWAVNWWERVWEEDSGEDIPLMRSAAVWMRENLPSVNNLSVLHGDFRIGNCLFDEQDGRITAWLDWELAHIGDRHEDLAWTTVCLFGCLAEDGKTFLANGLMPLEEFYETYERVTGLTVDPKTLHFYRVLNTYKATSLGVGTAYRIVRGGKTHLDVVALWCMGVAGAALNELRNLLEQGV